MNFLRALSGCESRAKTPYQALVIHWLRKVTDDPAVQGAGPRGFERHKTFKP